MESVKTESLKFSLYLESQMTRMSSLAVQNNNAITYDYCVSIVIVLLIMITFNIQHNMHKIHNNTQTRKV